MQMLFVGKKPQLVHYGVMLLLLEEPAAKNFLAQKFEQLTSSDDYLMPWKLASVMLVQLKIKILCYNYHQQFIIEVGYSVKASLKNPN